MSLNAATGESMESIVHNNHLDRVPDCFRIGETMTVSNLMFKLINDSLNDIVSPWKSRIMKMCPDEVHF